MTVLILLIRMFLMLKTLILNQKKINLIKSILLWFFGSSCEDILLKIKITTINIKKALTECFAMDLLLKVLFLFFDKSKRHICSVVILITVFLSPPKKWGTKKIWSKMKKKCSKLAEKAEKNG